MEWQIIVALVIAVPIILIPVVFVWYLNAGGVFRALQVFRQRRRASRERMVEAASEADSK
jgi:hypothetical protein